MCGYKTYHLGCGCDEKRFKYCDKATKEGTAKGTVNVPCGSGKPPGEAYVDLKKNKCQDHRDPKPFDPSADPFLGTR